MYQGTKKLPVNCEIVLFAYKYSHNYADNYKKLLLSFTKIISIQIIQIINMKKENFLITKQKISAPRLGEIKFSFVCTQKNQFIVMYCKYKEFIKGH